MQPSLSPVARRAIWDRRRGYHGKPTEPVSVPEQARDVVRIVHGLELSTDHHVFPVTASAETAGVVEDWIRCQRITSQVGSVPSR